MSERPVEIPVSKALRDKIKILKKGLTYEEFLGSLINKKLSSTGHHTVDVSQERPSAKKGVLMK